MAIRNDTPVRRERSQAWNGEENISVADEAQDMAELVVERDGQHQRIHEIEAVVTDQHYRASTAQRRG